MKCVLIQKNHVHIENAAGTVAFFRTLEEAELYTQQDFSGARGRFITYQPDDNINDWDGEQLPIPNSMFEAVIANVDTILADKDDPYSNVSLEKAKVAKIGEVRALARSVKNQNYSAGSNILSVDGLQSLEEIQTQSILALVAGDAAWVITVIMENQVDGINVRRDFSAAQAINFIRKIWARNEAVNQIAQNNIDRINVLTTVADVKAYVITNN